MEEREKDHLEKANRLVDKYSKDFKEITFTAHPSTFYSLKLSS
jgi:hypothetical protein